MATYCADCGKQIDPHALPSHECKEQRRMNRQAAREATMCTGCGAKTIDTSGWWYGDHADTYSGTVWHCPTCAKVCRAEAR